jgi:two-component system, sensor histidine kinase and response regulator
MKPKKNILIVDDNQINLQVVSSFLKELNYNIVVSLDGFEAIKILKKTQIDLIVLDVMMPQMDGFETCKKIKEDDRLKEIPIIFLTAKTQTKDIIEGFQAGGVDYVTKPFNGEELKMRIRTHLELADAKQTILQFHKTRDRIYSILAHDIRSPLASISMLLDGLAGKYIDSSGPNFDKLITEISLSTKNTLTLIQNILEWTKTQSDIDFIIPRNY